MTGTLKYRLPSKEHSLPNQLKIALQREYELGASVVTMGLSDLPFLRGLLAAHVPGASDLIMLINKHDEVELRIEY